jgi:hypothetical protein
MISNSMIHLKQEVMKRILIIALTLVSAGMAFGQKDPYQQVFDKYTGKEGITAVNINGDMLNMFTQADSLITSKLTSIQVLAVEKSCDKPQASVNFLNEISGILDKSVYKEMLNVKESDQEVHIYIKEQNGRISDMIIVVSGQKDNALVRIQGDMLLSEMSKMMSQTPMKGFEQLKALENK